MIAYDFETTRIARGTPRPLYLTAHGLNPAFSFDGPIDSMEHLSTILETRFLTDDLSGARYVAWNANNFDSYFIAAALLQNPAYILRPYLTRSNALRGLRVLLTEDQHLDPKAQRHWEFLDGIAMLGLVGTSLEKFLKTFAPDHAKLTGVIDWSIEEFNHKNKLHREYAYRDSEGLYHGMKRAETILLDTFNQGLGVTMGGACIKIFKSHIPHGAFVANLPSQLNDTTREYLMRGGYCYCVAPYEGPVWKYDLNQAYAAAMREAKLPQGKPMHSPTGIHRFASIYAARITATHPTNTIPVYHRTLSGGRMKSVFSVNEIPDTWLTNIEIQQLKAEGWNIQILESWTWPDSFNMKDYVDKLERIRTTCEGGPSGPVGTMIKAVGNHSYGKVLEVLQGVEYLLSADQPEGFAPYYADGFEPLPHVWYAFTDAQVKDYHQPQIGAWITAHVRMIVRRAALLAPAHWLYADTDCVVFSQDMSDQLDIDSKRYGAWKKEEQGTPFRIIAKKVYQNMESGQGHAKGLNVRRLVSSDYEAWIDGQPPIQEQTQRNNFVKVMSGVEMFRTQTRRGTAIVPINRQP